MLIVIVNTYQAQRVILDNVDGIQHHHYVHHILL